ncbi:hypothetical protein [Glutamicibacter arilaitensis]|uniref:hypothetical protein n=1 Tax=Glutamicibacter arilaitensis TaxID=256701 RepID=UPI003FD2780C
MSIEGILDVAGTFNVSGTSTFSGALTIAGPTGITGDLTIQGVTDITGQLNVTGPTSLDGVTTIGGDTTITGLLDVEGRTTISADLELLTGGKFIAGQTTIEPSGKASFGDFVIDPDSNKLIDSPAGWLFTNGPDSIGLASSLTSSVNLDNTRAELNYGGASPSLVKASTGRVDLTAAKTWISGEVEAAGTANWRGLSYFHKAVRFNDSTFILANLPTTDSPANLYIDPATGRLSRSTA